MDMPVVVTVKSLDGARLLADFETCDFVTAMQIIRHSVTMRLMDEFDQTGTTVFVSRSRRMMFRLHNTQHVNRPETL